MTDRSGDVSQVIAELLMKLETYYDFESTGGPLRNCLEWQQLRALLRDRPALSGQPEEQEGDNFAMDKMREIEERNRNLRRREVLMLRVLHGLRQTARLRGMTPETPVDDVMIEFTNKSEQYLAPLLEAVDILEAIVFASDGCRGHRDCMHTMEPWQRARALLQGKWDADSSCGESEWPEVPKMTGAGQTVIAEWEVIRSAVCPLRHMHRE